MFLSAPNIYRHYYCSAWLELVNIQIVTAPNLQLPSNVRNLKENEVLISRSQRSPSVYSSNEGREIERGKHYNLSSIKNRLAFNTIPYILRTTSSHYTPTFHPPPHPPLLPTWHQCPSLPRHHTMIIIKQTSPSLPL